MTRRKENGAIVVVIQRLHEDDLAGHLLQQGEWMHLNLPSIAIEDDHEIPLGRGLTYRRKQRDLLHPERESRATLEPTSGISRCSHPILGGLHHHYVRVRYTHVIDSRFLL